MKLNTRTAAVLGLLGAAGAALAGDDVNIIYPDLAIFDLAIEGFGTGDDAITIDVSYRVENVGEIPVDFANGPNGPNPNAVGLQSLIGANELMTESVVASGGNSLPTPFVLDPGESFFGTYTANTGNLLDPFDLGDIGYLMLYINNVHFEENLANNAGVVALPTPGSAALLGLAGLSVARRRRRG